MSGLNLRLKVAENKLERFNQVIVVKLKTQWLSGLNLRLKVAENKLGRFNQVIVIKLKTQWLSGLNLRLNDLLETYSQLCGGGQTKRKSFDFLFLAHSLKIIFG
ncbi:hypothetical protein [Globicatella sp. PHS-GS-PNBC-21-1553]|uniref:hypothetical protein n=1 Tax=Globicatella sp. PHS-GS-PNBC-21-1553 TaxID=2885764 RepID=UPI00298F1B12|nr:hypothetical protein [Globicatella sp. PHS-GS-PNBC-21-1553]WPC08670.1 hypothetical protein LB888_11895 [Globicatella sp. PHS-GS-PNBC-21-1553]